MVVIALERSGEQIVKLIEQLNQEGELWYNWGHSLADSCKELKLSLARYPRF